MGHKIFAISKYQLGAGKLSTVLIPILISVALDKSLSPPHLTASWYVFSTLSVVESNPVSCKSFCI